MADLIKELGVDFCNDMLLGAGFLYNGVPHVLEAVNMDRSIVATKLSTNPDKLEAEEVIIPPGALTGWSSLAFPALGYRMACNGQVLCYLSRANSVRRGLSLREMRVDFHDVARECSARFGINLHHYIQNATKAVLALSPSYLTFLEGMKKIMSKEIPAFAMSADFAVAPNDEVPFLEILFRERRIGTVDENGNVTITSTKIKHSWDEAVKGDSANAG